MIDKLLPYWVLNAQIVYLKKRFRITGAGRFTRCHRCCLTVTVEALKINTEDKFAPFFPIELNHWPNLQQVFTHG